MQNQSSQNIHVDNLCVKYGDKLILKNVSFSVDKGQWCMLIGPNGTGKSTFVSAMSRNLNYEGSIYINGKNINQFSNEEYAKNVAFLSQKNLVAYDFSIEEIVSMGRYCHKSGFFKNLDKQDIDIVNNALDITGLSNIKERSILEISGGEVQRTFIAQLFAQDANILVLDEPTNNLDLVYQEQIFELLKKWINEKQGTIISVVHDIALAKYYGSNAVLLNNGRIASSGDMNEVLIEENLNKVYGMDVKKFFDKLYSSF